MHYITVILLLCGKIYLEHFIDLPFHSQQSCLARACSQLLRMPPKFLLPNENAQQAGIHGSDSKLVGCKLVFCSPILRDLHPTSMGVNPKIGVFPPTWMDLIMENHIKMDDLGVFPLFLETSI